MEAITSMKSIKAILFDVDGVVNRREAYFDAIYAQKQSIPRETLTPFFRGPFALCKTGKADVKEELSKLLKEWNWTGSVDELMAFWLETENQPDSQVLGLVEWLRTKSVPCYLATDQEKYRAKYLMDEMSMSQYFDGAFFSCELGFPKSDPEFFSTALRLLNLSPEHVLFVDDDIKNINIAQGLGINVIHFSGVDDISHIKSYFAQ